MASPQTLVPEIRFRGFSDEWTKRKIEEFCDVVIGEFVIKTKQRDDALYPVYNGGKSNTGFYDEFNQEGKKVIISARGAAGYVNRCETRFWAGNSCYSLSILDNSDWNCLYHCLKKKQSDLIREQQSANIPSVSKQAVIETLISMPGPEEQRNIATLLDHIDSIIELNKKEYTQYKNVKKSMLEKMFPRDGNNVPEIRFAGFTNPWEQRKLKDAFDFLQNNTLSRADLSLESGAAKNIHYGDVLIKFGEYIDASETALPYIQSQQIVDKYKGSILKDGDIIMADTAEDETVGKCTEIANLQGFPTLSGLHTIPLRPKDKFAKGFLGYYMNSGAYHDQLLPLMQGIKVTSISKGALQDTDISYPSYSNEQAAIGQYFINLDRLITLHQRKYEMLQKIKNSLLQKMLV